MPNTAVETLRILLIDDHTIVRSGLRMLIETRPGWVVVGETSDRAGALELAAREQPDIIVLDLDLGSENGLDFLPQLGSVAESARVLILTGVNDTEMHRRGVRLGARGVVLKDNAVNVLLDAIETVRKGEVWLDRTMAAILVAEMQHGKAGGANREAANIGSLTPREREVIRLVCTGMKNKEIADRLSISEATIRNHVTSILSKLGVSDRFALALYAFRHGLGEPPDKA